MHCSKQAGPIHLADCEEGTLLAWYVSQHAAQQRRSGRASHENNEGWKGAAITFQYGAAQHVPPAMAQQLQRHPRERRQKGAYSERALTGVHLRAAAPA